MKIYQLTIGHNNYDDGFVIDAVRCYTSRAEAEKAKAWYDSIPIGPYDIYEMLSEVNEVEVYEKFLPWMSEEQVQAYKDEIAEHEQHHSAMKAQDDAIYQAMLDATEVPRSKQD